MDNSHILNLLPYGIAEFTAEEGRYLFFNEQEKVLRGLSAETLRSTSIFELYPTEQAEALKHCFQKCSAADEGNEFFFTYQKNNRHYQMRLVKSKDSILSILSDITSEHHLKEKALEDQETIKCLNDAVNGANIGCWDFYPQEGRIIANETWVTQKKYPDSEFRESDAIFSEVIDGLERWSSIVHPDDLEPTVELIEKHLNGETEVYDARFRMICGDGKWRWIHDVGKVFQRDEQGNAIRMNGVHIDISEARALEEKIEKLAVTDSLTGLFNRRNFEYLSDSLIERAKRENSFFCLIILDIDHFKQYNDTYGHLEGDEVLKKISQTLRKNVRRGNDYCFRVGGEEFAVIFTERTKGAATALAERIKNEVESLAIPHKHNGASQYVTISLGLMMTKDFTDEDPISAIYQHTDELLYKAKESGRNKLISG
ncbi:sensor domain-containing diguanylate cyclase [Neptuniibacter caesariensis]|uniref:diguanylate cyclase n=1 Tax=Neptuniibacter caesariensis TaxID=207954 RepID=A0A7U8GTG0_NEPCE|nr:diguanylate cyclase [Neptuniibacter caesariensis]EAR62293.1 Signal transduction histidine kinase [Oceanospirillum sp. MED92] [Neptuniibacter caesariensis]